MITNLVKYLVTSFQTRVPSSDNRMYDSPGFKRSLGSYSWLVAYAADQLNPDSCGRLPHSHAA